MLIIVDELLINLNMTKVDMWVIQNMEGFHEVATLIENDTIQVKDYKGIFSCDWPIQSGKINSRVH